MCVGKKEEEKVVVYQNKPVSLVYVRELYLSCVTEFTPAGVLWCRSVEVFSGMVLLFAHSSEEAYSQCMCSTGVMVS